MRFLSGLLAFGIFFQPLSASAKITFGAIGVTNPEMVEGAKISPLEKGDKAPFLGTLFNGPAVAKLLVDMDSQKQQCLIEKDKELEKQGARHELELLNMRAAKEAAERRSEEIVALKNEQIKFIQEQAINAATKEKNMPAIIAGSIGGGVLAGVLLTVAAAFVVREVR